MPNSGDAATNPLAAKLKIPVWLRVATAALALAGIIVGFYSAYMDRGTVATASLAAGILLLLIGQLDRFEVLKGWGFEAKLKAEELDRKILEAEEVYRQMAALAAVVGHVSMDTLARVGRWSSPMKRQSSHALAAGLSDQLNYLNVSGPQHEAVFAKWREVVASDLAWPAIQIFQKCYGAANDDVEKLRKNVPSPTPVDDSAWVDFLARSKRLGQTKQSVEVVLNAPESDKPMALMDALTAHSSNPDTARHLPPEDDAAIREALKDLMAWVTRRCQRHSGIDTATAGIGTSDLIHRVVVLLRCRPRSIGDVLLCRDRSLRDQSGPPLLA